MQRVPIQWARQTAQGRQIASDGSRLLNFYAVEAVDPSEAKVPVSLYGTPGTRRFHTAAGGDGAAGIWGLLPVESPTFGLRLFGVTGGNNLFEARYAASYERFPWMGADPAEPATMLHRFTQEADDYIDGPVRMVTDGRRIFWAWKREVYMWDMRTDAFVTVLAPTSDDDAAALPDEEWVDVEWVDGYFLLAARSGQFFHSLVDSVQFDQLDFSKASVNPDELVGMRAHSRRIYLFGSKTIEQWANTGARDFAFSRDNSQTIDVGCAARDSIAATDTYLFFVGSDRICYQMRDAGYRRFSNEAVDYDLADCEIEKSRAFTYTEEGHKFYSLSLYFPAGARDVREKNWTYDLTTGLWHERTLSDVVASTVFAKRLLLAREGQTHVFDQRLRWAEQDGQAISREAIAPVLHADQARVECHDLELDIPYRPGDDAGTMQLDWSDDNQRTWKDASRAAQALNLPRLKWTELGGWTSGRHFRIRTSARRPLIVLGAYATVTAYSD